MISHPEHYENWVAAQQGNMLPVVEAEPGSGFWRIKSAGGIWLPVAIWREDDLVWVQVGKEEPNASVEFVQETWLRCAKHWVSEKNYRHVIATGSWLGDPPAPITDAAPPPPTPTEQAIANAQPPERGPGDNSGNLDAFQAMRAELLNDAAEAIAHFTRHPITTKDEADKCENWRKRIAASANAADEKRKAEKKPHQDAADAVDARYFPVIREAKAKAEKLRGLGDTWVRNEQERLRKAAEEEARIERERRWAEDRATALEAAPSLEIAEKPPADLPPPVVETPKVLIGTSGTRRGATAAPATATITDLKAAALYYATQQNPELIELIQKLANRAAKAKATIPGCTMSWERSSSAA